MNRLCLAALAAGMLTAAPAHALEIRVNPTPLYVFDLSPDRASVDLVLHNILIVNDGEGVQEIHGMRVEFLAKGEIVSVVRAPASMIARRAERIANYSDAGLLQAMDFQFHLSHLLKPGETLSRDATLDPREAFLNTSLYVSASTMPDTARIVVEGENGDIESRDVAVSRYQSPNTYRAPVDGRWIVWASGDAAHHHRWVQSSEYAIDIARLGADLRSFRGDGTQLEDYLTFGAPLYAVADGVVVAVRDDQSNNAGGLRRPDEPFEAYQERVAEAQQAILLSDGFAGAAGNYILLRHKGGEHSLYAHIRQGSARVRVGQAVSSGAQIGEAGTSGNSTEPHLHFQIIDGPDLNTARGLPFVFEGLRNDWIEMSGRHLRAGDVIERE